MRKTSQDGGDAISTTSGVENEIKKSKIGLLEFKSKKVAKRMPPNLSEESDDAVVEPLLQKATNNTIQSAKYLAKAKADTVKEISKLFNDKKSQYASTSGITDVPLSDKDEAGAKPNASSNAPLHNHMNTNIFHSHDNSKVNVTTKSQLLVEIDGSKQSEYNPSPLIFTTAKIHLDGKSKHMEPVQMTPTPILSTVELSVSKSGSITTNEKKVSNGTPIMNTLYSQPNASEKANTVNVSHQNVAPVTQTKDNIVTDKTCNASKPSTTNSKYPAEILSHVNDKTESTDILNANITSIPQSVIGKTAHVSKPSTTLSNNPLEIRSPPETSKSITLVDHKNKPEVTRDTKDTKKLIDEPRILLSESKLKSTVADNIKTIATVKTAKSPLEQTKALESSSKHVDTIQPNKIEKLNSEKNNTSFDQDTKSKCIEIEESQSIQNKNIQSPLAPKELAIKSNNKLTKPLQQKNTTVLVGAQSTKTETKMNSPSSSKKSELNDPSAKKLSSAKTKMVSKTIDSKDKSPKPSANESIKAKSKIATTTAPSSANMLPTSASITKPATNASSPNVIGSNTNDTVNKSLNNPSLSNSKTVPSTTIAPSPTATKTKPTSTKPVTSTVSTKPNPVTSVKSATKPSQVSSIKSPQIISNPTTTSVTKQLNTTSAKPASGKPASLVSTKIPQVNISNPNVTTPSDRPMVSKIAQESTSHTTGHASSPVASSSTTAVEATNKTKAPESNKKPGSKPNDHTKDTKNSKP